MAGAATPVRSQIGHNGRRDGLGDRILRSQPVGDVLVAARTLPRPSTAIDSVLLCHGVLMYLEDPIPMIDALSALTDDHGTVSIVAKNVDVLAVRPALEGDWATALAAFDTDRQINGPGTDTRGDNVNALFAMLAARGVESVDWYGVRLFTDGWTCHRPPTDDEDVVLAVELEASRREPYRQLNRLFHLIAQRQ